ncbi:MAG: carotenoid oxygenase family protein [Deltaproteobacteria bacterium]|nr:carotenoid oxygenase family protein [Deltaproteobacteria bacterium]
MHLLGGLSLGASPWLAGCGDDGAGSGSSSSSGPGGSGSGGTGAGTTMLPGSSGGASSSGMADGTASTGEPTGCDAGWWLCGNYGPVEEHEAFDLAVEGTLPPALEGLYVRNGPNPWWGVSDHWFLGDGMVHGLQLSGGQASWYRARYIETSVLGVPLGEGGPPTPTNHQANTSIISHAGRLLTLAEVGLPYELSASDLSTLGTHDFGGQLAGAMTAHPKVDPQTGEMVFFGYELFDPSVLVHRVDAAGALVNTEVLPLPAAAMIHDFQLTQNHAVFLDMPILFDLDLAIAGEGLPFSWEPDNGARIGILPRNGVAADVVWIDIDVGFVFHTYNAYEDAQGNVVLDTVWYPQMWVEGPNSFSVDGVVRRYTVDPVRGTVTEEVVSELQAEFPKIDPRRQGLPYRWGYGVSNGGSRVPGKIPPPTALVKHDMERGTSESYAIGGGLHLDEVLFVPDSPGAGEDEGWLLGYAYDPARDDSRLLVLDATSIAAGPVASIALPQRVPHGFHGTWVPSA